MKPMFNSLTLRTRIYLSAALLVAVSCVASGIGWYGQTALLTSAENYEAAELVIARIWQLDRSMQELKAKSENYIHSGTQSAYFAADRLLAELTAEVAEMRRLSDNRELTDLLEEMTLHLGRFGEQLNLAAEERALRSTIVNSQLPRKADGVQAAIRDLQTSLDASGQQTSTAALLEIVQAFGEGRKQLLRYLIDPDSEKIDKMLVALERATTLAKSVANDAQGSRDRRNVLAERLQDFEQLALRVIQATRGYLYHSHVVMAGAISEFVYYADRVKDYVHGQQQLNRRGRTAAAKQTLTLSVVASFAALVFALVLATGLSYSIIRPVSLLTKAFRRLAGGETLENIPGADREDEIGRMSQAAQVFSAKNQETQDLLAQSQTLSAQLAEKAQALEETNLELDNFAYVASHDLKAPLRGIHSLAEWVCEDCEGLLPEDSSRHLVEMQDRVERMNRLLDDLLEYSRVGRLEQKVGTVDLAEMVRDVIRMSDNPTGVRIELITEMPKLRTPVAPLRQVMVNLLTNAIKYNDRGVDGLIEVSCEESDGWLSICVADNGIGIDPRYHDRVFQMYQRVAPRQTAGSGMGLAIVKKQVEYHGGRITLESTAGDGARFTFTWPKHANALDVCDEVEQRREFDNLLAGV